MVYIKRMRYVKLNETEKETLENAFKFHPKSHVRRRCHVLLLSNEGWKVKNLVMLYCVRSRTIYTWMDRWRDMGIVGLMILPGRGVKPKLSDKDSKLVKVVKKNAARLAAA